MLHHVEGSFGKSNEWCLSQNPYRKTLTFILPAISLLTLFAELGLHITGAFDAGAHTVIEADAIDAINECSQCMQPRLFRDHRVRNLTNLPIVGFPTRLAVQLPHYRCIDPPATLSISLQVLVALPMAQKSPTGALGSLCND